VDRKDATIKSLVRNLGEAERQESMALQNHIQNVDRLVDFHESFQTEHHDTFNDDVSTLKDEVRPLNISVAKQADWLPNEVQSTQVDRHFKRTKL
jgi:hypothetical protein